MKSDILGTLLMGYSLYQQNFVLNVLGRILDFILKNDVDDFSIFKCDIPLVPAIGNHQAMVVE